MGLRDRIKQTAKSLLGRTEPARAPAAASPGAVPAAVAPAAAPIARPAAPTVAAPVAPGVAAPGAGTELDGFVAVAPSAKVTEQKAGTYPLPDGTIVAVFRHGGKLYVIDNACAHEDGPVGEGDIAGTCVRCPYHDWEYDFTTGACRTEPERALATYAVREHGGTIYVGPRLTEGTKARGGDHNDGLETITR